MILLITGSSHSGKTNLAQQLLARYHVPYLSLDHLKMGMIRSNMIKSTVMEDDKITNEMWPMVVEIIKTVIENNQNLIIEGIYIPFNYRDYFEEEYLEAIAYSCIVLSKQYINNNFKQIVDNRNIIENRKGQSTITKAELMCDNYNNYHACLELNLKMIYINNQYEIDFEIFDQVFKDLYNS